MQETLFFYAIYLFGTFISSIGQILLKKAAVRSVGGIESYLSLYIFLGYGLFLAATIMSVCAFRVVPLKMGPVLESSGYLWIALLNFLVFRKKISLRGLWGIGLIIFGIIVFMF